MIKLGITGGIGCGKTYVARLLENRGVPVYDTDKAARRLMNTDAGIREALVRLLGPEAYLPDGGLNKPVVAAYLFSSTSHAGQINGIVHPAVREDFRRWTEERSEPLVAIECAILYESGFDDLVDVVATVYAPEHVRMERAMCRDSATETQVRARMSMQWTDEVRCARADYIIRNDGTTDIQVETDALIEHLLAAL